VGRAVEHGMKALALTDTAGLYGAIPFYRAAREAGIKPILGAKLDATAAASVNGIAAINGIADGVILLARDREGYSALCRIITESTENIGTDYGFSRENVGPILIRHPQASRLPNSAERVPLDVSGVSFVGLLDPEHLFVLTSNPQLIEHLYAHGIEPLVAITHYGDRASRYRAERLRDFALSRGLRPVAVNPVYFLDPEHIAIHRVLTAIRLNTTIDNLSPNDVAPPGAWFRSPKEMADLYGDWPETLSNIEWVIERCNLEFSLGKPLFPESDLPEGETPFSHLWKLAFDGIKDRYKPLTPEVIDRLRYELSVIQQLGFAPYFLIVHDIVRYAREHDIPIVGRGSAANSIVAYALSITRVDPFKYDLYFERFLNLSRTDCPDIDLDICWRRRDQVIDYVYERYGRDRVAMICTFNTFQARSAVREVAKAHGMTDDEVRDVTRHLPHYHAGDIRSVVEHLPECRGLRIDEEPLKSIVAISEFIDGFPRHLSIHSGGLVIAPEPLTNFVPLQRATKGILITQYDMGPIEQLGLVKMDLLGHRSLTVIDETVGKIWENRGLRVDVERVPDPDPLTAALIRSGNTIGCFQIESPAMRALLRNTLADNTDMLIKTLSLVRPGPSGSGMKKHFIDRHLGREEVVYLHPTLERVLGDTYGVMLYQEDILKVASVIAGMTLAEADNLRRAMSKKRGPKEMARSMKTFLEKAAANGVGAAEAEAIWELIANFAEYSYCKAHASTYGEIAYQCTYLKAHFPAEFLAGVLSNRGGFYHPAVYVEEASRLGITILPPDINRSEHGYTAEGDDIRMGFVEIRNLPHHAVTAILEARGHDPFRGISDLYRRTSLSPGEAEILILAGACDGLGRTRPEMLWELKALAARGAGKSKASGDLLFPSGAGDSVVRMPEYSRRKHMDSEWSALGLLFSSHPLEYYAPALLEYPLILSDEMAAYAGGRATLAGWLIAERRVGLKQRGCMKFLTLEDPGGVFEAVLFPRAYQEFGHLLTSHGPYLLTGEIQEEYGYHSLIVDHVERAGLTKKSPGLSEITPPARWMFAPLLEDGVTRAD